MADNRRDGEAMLSNEQNEMQHGDKPKQADNEQKERLKEWQQASQKMRKRILIALAVIVGVLLLLFGVVQLIDLIAQKNASKLPVWDYDFYPVYEGNIFENEQYMSLDRQVYYCADPAGYGEEVSISEENLLDFDAGVSFLYFYLQTVIAGDTEKYNAYFNETYYKSNASQSEFSPQMLYDMHIRYLSEEALDGGEKRVSFSLRYCIHRNDGTFRRDIGSDMSREQIVTLRMSPTKDDIAIEAIQLIINQNKP